MERVSNFEPLLSKTGKTVQNRELSRMQATDPKSKNTSPKNAEANQASKSRTVMPDMSKIGSEIEVCIKQTSK